MSRGNFRSGKDHGPAEVGSLQRVFSGFAMRVSGRYSKYEDAMTAAAKIRHGGYIVHITEGRKFWTVWRTYLPAKNQAKVKMA